MNPKRKRTAEEQALYDQVELTQQDVRAAKLKWAEAEKAFYDKTKPMFQETPAGRLRVPPPPRLVEPLVYDLLAARDAYDDAVRQHEELKSRYSKLRGNEP